MLKPTDPKAIGRLEVSLTHVVEKRPGYIALIFEGHFDGSAVPIFIETVIQVCQTEKAERILLDVRKATGTLGTLDRFKLGRDFAERFLESMSLGKIPRCRFATLGKPPLVQVGGLASTVAGNRGIDDCSFNDLTAAFTWLNAE